jgi:hypothetical protein
VAIWGLGRDDASGTHAGLQTRHWQRACQSR